MKNFASTILSFSFLVEVVFITFLCSTNLVAAELKETQQQPQSVRTFPFSKGPQKWNLKIRLFTPGPLASRQNDFFRLGLGGIRLGMDFHNMLAFEIGGGMTIEIVDMYKGGYFHVLAGIAPTIVDRREMNTWRGRQLQIPILIGMNIFSDWADHDGKGSGQRTAAYIKLMTGPELTKWYNQQIGLVFGLQLALNFQVAQKLGGTLESTQSLPSFYLEPQLSIGIAF